MKEGHIKKRHNGKKFIYYIQSSEIQEYIDEIYCVFYIFTSENIKLYTCVPAPKCGRRPHFGAVGIAGLYIGRLRNCLPFLTSFTQCRMANLHIKCFDINAYQRLECYRALR